MAEGKQTFRARIALLMATRNQAQLLRQALDSLLGQSHQQFTLTLINDGSDDLTPEVLTRYQDPRLQILSTRPQGLIPSLNLAFQKSKPAAFYAVVYASCFYDPYFLEKMLNKLQRNPLAAGVFCNYCSGHAKTISGYYEEPFYSTNELLVRNTLGPGVLFRSESFQQAGGLFLSERKGIWESWQRLAQQGPFVKVPEALLRWQPQSYEAAPKTRLDPDKELYPFLQTRILQLPEDPGDFDLINLLHQAGHKLIQEEQLKGRAELILCSRPEKLPLAFEKSYQHYAPILLVLNELQEVQKLFEHPRMRFLLGSCTFATRTLKVAQWLKQQHHQALVYMHGMTKREVNRLLSRIPLVINRHRSLILIRAQGNPRGLEKTLASLNNLNHPPDFGELLIFCIDQNPKLIDWLKNHRYTWFAARQNAYYPDLLFLLRQIKASYVLNLDAGVVPATDYYTQLWPLLSDPRVAMVAGHLNQGPGAQALPLSVKDPLELSKVWPRYRPQKPLIRVKELSDNAFLIRKSTLEWALEAFPQTLPLADETLLSKQLVQAGFQHVLNRKTVAFNLLHTL